MTGHSRVREIEHIETFVTFRFTKPLDNGGRDALDGNRTFTAMRGIRLVGQQPRRADNQDLQLLRLGGDGPREAFDSVLGSDIMKPIGRILVRYRGRDSRRNDYCPTASLLKPMVETGQGHARKSETPVDEIANSIHRRGRKTQIANCRRGVADQKIQRHLLPREFVLQLPAPGLVAGIPLYQTDLAGPVAEAFLQTRGFILARVKVHEDATALRSKRGDKGCPQAAAPADDEGRLAPECLRFGKLGFEIANRNLGRIAAYKRRKFCAGAQRAAASQIGIYLKQVEPLVETSHARPVVKRELGGTRLRYKVDSQLRKHRPLAGKMHADKIAAPEQNCGLRRRHAFGDEIPLFEQCASGSGAGPYSPVTVRPGFISSALRRFGSGKGSTNAHQTAPLAPLAA